MIVGSLVKKSAYWSYQPLRPKGDAVPMSNMAAKLRARRAEIRTRRALNRAIDTAASATIRQELMAIARARFTR
jgi:hypothetical protein